MPSRPSPAASRCSPPGRLPLVDHDVISLIDHKSDHGQNVGQMIHPPSTMPTIQASEFKAKCLALMDEVARTGTPILITKNGKPVAELRPHRPPRARTLVGLHKGQISIVGDVVAPLGGDRWEALG